MNMKNYSIWLDNIETSKLKTVAKNMTVEVLIVGGGITGISTLYQLRESNLKTILVERNICGHGVTARSTAKITYLQEKIYMNIRKYSEDKAIFYLKSQIDAVKILKNIVDSENIKCDLRKVSSYIFTNEEKNLAMIEDEFTFLKNAKVDVKKENNVPTQEEVKIALSVDDTYVFHPLKYINSIKEMFKDNIYENSKLESIKRKGIIIFVKLMVLKLKLNI